jgi:hypothetical protein
VKLAKIFSWQKFPARYKINYGNSLEVIGGGGGLIAILRGLLAPITPIEQLSNGISPSLRSKSADNEQNGTIFPGL